MLLQPDLFLFQNRRFFTHFSLVFLFKNCPKLTNSLHKNWITPQKIFDLNKILSCYFISCSVFNAMSLLRKCLCGCWRPKASSFSRSPSSLGLSPAVQKKIETPDDKVLQRRVQSWGLRSCCDSCCLIVASSSHPDLGPSVTSDQTITPGRLTTAVRKNYLHHEWTRLFIEMVFVAPKPSLYFK